MIRKNKAFALLTIILSVTVFGVLVFSASATEELTTEDVNTLPFGSFRNSWLDDLTDEQLTTLQEMIKENKAEIGENRAEIQSQLEAWGVEIPMRQGPRGLLEDLTEEQKDELRIMKQNFHDSVNTKLEDWGVEVPEFDDTNGFCRGFRGRCARGFGLFKP